jgi:hypothetical protein
MRGFTTWTIASLSACGTFVWTGRALQAEYDDLEMIGLALLYPALERSVCAPGHHGYPRTSDLSEKGPERPHPPAATFIESYLNPFKAAAPSLGMEAIIAAVDDMLQGWTGRAAKTDL